MPHKQKRKGGDKHHDLPPGSKHAAPLPTSKTQNGARPPKRRTSGKFSGDDDDTPKAFRRLLERQRSLTQRPPKRAPADDVNSSSTKSHSSKKRKTSQTAGNNSSDASETAAHKSAFTSTKAHATTLPPIQPHERLSDYGARIDASLPLSGLARKGNKPLQLGHKTLKPPQTRTEKKMQRMQAEWRAAAAKRREKEEEARDEAEFEELGREGSRVSDVSGSVGGGGGGGRFGVGGKKGKWRKRREEDPWAVLEERRLKARFGDVVDRPPDLGALKGVKLRVREGRDGV